jgi:hypothetical protein
MSILLCNSLYVSIFYFFLLKNIGKLTRGSMNMELADKWSQVKISAGGDICDWRVEPLMGQVKPHAGGGPGLMYLCYNIFFNTPCSQNSSHGEC